MEDFEIVPERAGGDEAIDAGPDGEAPAPSDPIERYRLQEQALGHRRLDDRKRQDRLAGDLERPLLPETLKDFLDYGKTGHDLIDLDQAAQVEPRGLPEYVDPNGSVNENQRVSSASRRPL